MKYIFIVFSNSNSEEVPLTHSSLDPPCAPHTPTLSQTTAAASAPVFILKWCDFVANPVVWCHSVLLGLPSVCIKWEKSWQRRVPLLIRRGLLYSPVTISEAISCNGRKWVKYYRIHRQFSCLEMWKEYVPLPLHFCTEFSATSPSRSGLLFEGTLMRMPKPRAKKPTFRLCRAGRPKSQELYEFVWFSGSTNLIL